ASIEETSSSMEEMASMTKNNAENAGTADGLMKEANHVVATANDSMGKLTKSIKVGDLIAEISAASKEQSSGIEQVNIAITEMDKVVQQNAANAEESASASEEMNAQAEQLRDYVGELVLLVTGKQNREDTAVPHKFAKKTAPGIRKQVRNSQKKLAGKTGEVRPDQVIPFDDDDNFKSF
ncbi:MAG: methyl-accepting chemotaxis protein, partial [Desulfobacteraceae bacterium]